MPNKKGVPDENELPNFIAAIGFQQKKTTEDTGEGVNGVRWFASDFIAVGALSAPREPRAPRGSFGNSFS